MSTQSRDESTANNFPPCYTDDTLGVRTTTTNDIPGHRTVQHLGTVYGITVRARNWGMDLGAVLKSSVGGEIRPVTSLLYTARNKAVDRMVGECLARGGNAIVGMRFDVVAQGFLTQVCAYGTAVVVKSEEQ